MKNVEGGWGGGGGQIKRTPEITTAFERQVQYRGLGKCWK